MKPKSEIDYIIKRYKKKYDLSKKYFVAVYRTRLLKYDGQIVPPLNQGNIVSRTCVFEADDEKDAKQRAPALFNVSNYAFDSLNCRKMEVEHELLNVFELTIPNIDEAELKHINKNVNGLYFCQRVKVVTISNDDSEIPKSFHGFYSGSIRRKMPHFDSQHKDISYLYHPWHGAGDGYTDWFEYKYGNPVWKKMEMFFNSRNKNNENRFYSTEYTSLRKNELVKVKKLKQLDWLSSYVSDFEGNFDSAQKQIRGRYILYKYRGGNMVVFREDKCS